MLLHKPPHVHHLHARHVVVDVVEGHQPEHLAHARGRHVARPEGEEFDESPAPSAPCRMLREGERQPLGTAGARARADLVHTRQGLALEDVEGVAVAAAAARHAVLTDQVPREDNAHAVAPRPDLVEVGRAELAAHQLGVDLPHGGGRRGGRALRVRRARREPRLDVRAEGAPRRRPVVRLQAAPPTEAGDRTPLEGHPRRMTGLVREDAPDRPVLEPPREALLVDLVRQLDEARDRLGFVDVHPALRRKELRPAVRAVRLAVDGVLGVTPGVVLAGDAAPARPARPVVLVVEPYLHAARLGLAAEPFVQPQPLLAHVGVLESAPGVDQELVVAHLLQARHLTHDVRFGGAARHRDKRDDGARLRHGPRQSGHDGQQHDDSLQFHVCIVPYFPSVPPRTSGLLIEYSARTTR